MDLNKILFVVSLFGSDSDHQIIGDNVLISFINSCDALSTWRPSSFGLDQRVQAVLDELRVAPGRKIFFRPVQEPGLLSFWADLQQPKPDIARLVQLATILVGRLVTQRTGRKKGTDVNGEDFRFKYPVDADWAEQIAAVAQSGLSLTEEIARVYTIWVFNHPLSDGNGRLARALVYGALARRGILSAPCLGLNAVFDTHRTEIGRSFRRAATTGDYSDLMRSISVALIIGAQATLVAHTRSHGKI